MIRIVRIQHISHIGTGRAKVYSYKMVVMQYLVLCCWYPAFMRGASSREYHHVCSCDGGIAAPPGDGKRDIGLHLQRESRDRILLKMETVLDR